MKIVITGGHLTPALALIEHLQQTQPEVEIIFFGREHSQRGGQQRSHEAEEIRGFPKVKFVPFEAPRLGGAPWWQAPALISQWLIAWIQATWLLLKHKPTKVISFGSYLAVPVAFAAYCLGIPVITHEQTATAGFASQSIGWVADRVLLSFSSSQKFFAQHKTKVVGLPLRPTLFDPTIKKPSWLTPTITKPILYITGGNQGSSLINQTILTALPELTKTWTVIHQTGRVTTQHDYLTWATKARQQLPAELRSRYFFREWVTGEELGWLYQHAKAVVGRAGANTVVELQTFGLPSVLVPLAQAHRHEQTLNAQWLRRQQSVVILTQSNFEPKSILKALSQLKKTSSPANPDHLSARNLTVLNSLTQQILT